MESRFIGFETVAGVGAALGIGEGFQRVGIGLEAPSCVKVFKPQSQLGLF